MTLPVALAAWWPVANLATHLLIAVALLWWLLDSRRKRRSQEELKSAVAAFDRLFEVAADVANDIEGHSERVTQIQLELAAWKDKESKQPADDPAREFLPLVEQLLESNLRLTRQLGGAETQLVDQRREIERHASAANRDSLTGLWNRRAFDLELQRCIAVWRDHQTPVVLLLIDVDYFKQINDGFGHPAGDRVLKTVVQVIARAVRTTDVLYRYGGDELAMVLSGATIESARLVAEKVRTAVARLGKLEDVGVTLSISCGMAAAREGDTGAAILRRADLALFSSKEHGRNRVSLHDGQTCTVISGGQNAGPSQGPGGAITANASAASAVATEAPPQGSLESLDKACEDLQKRLDEVTRD